MSHTAKRRDKGARRRSVSRAMLLAAVVLLIGGCSLLGRQRQPPREQPGKASRPPAAQQTARPQEDLVGPPAPPGSAELEGPPELVGPPAPSAPEASAPLKAEEQEMEPPVSEARAGTPDAALLAELGRVGAEAHPSARGPVVVLPDTIFELGTSILQRDAKRKVHEIGRVLSERAFSTRIAVEGHSDSTGAEMYNEGLSQRRASAVASELAAAGVARKFLTAKGLGSQFPIAPNERSDGSDDPQGRARNRRVEIVVETAFTPGG